MSNQNAPRSPAELDRWCAAVDAAAETDRLAGITSTAVMNAGDAAVAAVDASRSR